MNIEIKIAAEEAASFLEEIRKYGINQGFELGRKNKTTMVPVTSTLEHVDDGSENRLKKIENHLTKLSGSYEVLATKMHEPALGRIPDEELIERIAGRTVAMITSKVEEDQGKADQELADMVSNLTFEKMLSTLIKMGLMDPPDPEKAEAVPFVPGESEKCCENAAEFYDRCVTAAGEDSGDVPADPRDDASDAILSGFVAYQAKADAAADEEPAPVQEEEKVLILEETGGETVGEHFHSVPAEDPQGEYTNKLTEPVVELAPEDTPIYDAETEMYLLKGQAYLGKELWLQKKYIGFFNTEIVRLLKEGQTRQRIADRLRVTGTSITNRIRKYNLLGDAE